MRQIGHLPSESEARMFGDFLIGRGIRNEVERETDTAWTVWVRDEDQVAEAEKHLADFFANPNAAEFRQSAVDAAEARAAVERDLAEYQRRVRTRQSLFPKMGGYGVGILTYALIIVCVGVAVYSSLGGNSDFLRRWFISDPETISGTLLPEVRAGEVWRLVSPIFIHFGPLHLIFNMMWLYQLGCMIEGRQSALHLAGLVIVTGLLSNLAQFYFTQSSAFGGMSGVVYGLAGYVWMRGKYDRASGLFLDRQSVTILLVWLVICYTGMVGPIANTAHLAGLIVGVIWGRVSALFGTRRSV